jgi:hypothetical protein
MSAVRQISRLGSVKLLADLLADAEEEVTKLRTLLVVHFCNCHGVHIDRLDVTHHGKHCRYRELLS